ncbi:DUF222 domain-containing protein, partial [Paenarthrobacter sp. NPDC089675]|uniref:DUF222 domain-containing protein n=1 Tax=Paenarthrobacter sp. NPDC089675 TaxID=3364376 RepID=UPI0037F33158
MGFGGQVIAERAGVSGAGAVPVARARGAVSLGAGPSTAAVSSGAVPVDCTTAVLTAAVPGPGAALPALGANDEPAHLSRAPRGDGSPGGVAGALEDSAAVLEGLRESAPEAAALFNAWEASDFAGRVEDLARTIGYLQILAAHAIERTREQAKHAPKTSTPGWRTGWTEPTTRPAPSTRAQTTTPQGPADGSILDDGYRNAAEFLRARLRIGIREARRRLTQAALLLPGTTPTGQPTLPRYEHLAHALTNTHLPSISATIITNALDTVARIAHPETLTTMEHTLTRAATETDPDFLAKTARRWIDHIDQDGPEPSEEELRTLQGAFLRKPRRGLHHIEIFATDEQYETLTTLMNTATNPRLTHGGTDNSDNHGDSDNDNGAPQRNTPTSGNAERAPSLPDLDRRSRAQKLLDGLVTGCQIALKTGELPANGGLKPQVTVTIDHRDLYNQLTTTPTSQEPQTPPPGTGTGTGTFT